MSDFNGFPPGDLKFSKIPDVFFSRVLPEIDDMAELKVTLHLMWLRQREKQQVVSLAELQTDETLIKGLARVSQNPFSALEYGLALAVERKTLLTASLNDDQGTHQLYFLNSEGGRLALEKMQSGELGVLSVNTAEVVAPYTPRPNIFELYEANIGLLSPILADELKDAEMTYPAEWIEAAFKIAVENNVRKWRYIRAILENMATEGMSDGTHQRQDKPDSAKRWFTDEEFKHLFEH